MTQSLLQRTMCPTCARETIHKGLKCLTCNVDRLMAGPASAPYSRTVRQTRKKVTQLHRSKAAEELLRELELGKLLHCDHKLMGLTTREHRISVIRQAILELGLENAPCSLKDCRGVTYAEVFRRTYGVPLLDPVFHVERQRAMPL